MKYRLLRLVGLTISTVLAFSACIPATGVPEGTGKPVTSTAAAPASTSTPGSVIAVDPAALQDIRIMVWHAFSGASAEAFTDQLATFNSTNEWGITVDQVSLDDHPSLFEAVNSALEEGELPDLVIALPEQILQWDETGKVINLNTYVSDPSWGMESSEVEAFQPVFWQQDEVDGYRVGVPAERSARFLFYNKTWARELGFDHAPVTSEEFKEQACAANGTFRMNTDLQDDGYGGWIVDADWMTVQSWLLAFGGGVTETRSYHFNTPENLTALEFLQTLKKDDACAWMTIDPENPSALDTGPFYEQFTHRSALFITGDLTEAAAFTTALSGYGSTDEWTMIPFPGPVKQAVTVYGPSYTIFKSTPEEQLAAWLFVRDALQPENQAVWVESTGTFPLSTTVTVLLGDYGSEHPQWADAVQALKFAQGVPQLASWRTIRYVLEDGTWSIFRENVHIQIIPAKLEEMDATAQELSGGE